jgi:hypothetical protein
LLDDFGKSIGFNAIRCRLLTAVRRAFFRNRLQIGPVMNRLCIVTLESITSNAVRRTSLSFRATASVYPQIMSSLNAGRFQRFELITADARNDTREHTQDGDPLAMNGA